jgi:hypothetical protein
VRFVSSAQGNQEDNLENEIRRILAQNCYYRIIDLPNSASKKEIKKRYIDMTKTFHPDLWNDNRAHGVYQKILEAYTVLEDDKKREVYDRFKATKRKQAQKENPEEWKNYQERGENQRKQYDYWNRSEGTGFHNFDKDHNEKQREYNYKYYEQQAKKDNEFYRKARKAGKARSTSQETEDLRKSVVGYGWLLLAAAAVYLFGGSLGDSLFGYDKKRMLEEKRKKADMLGHMDRDSENTINNRLEMMQKELERKKVVISVERDTISLESKQMKKMRIPKHVKQMNKRMKKAGFEMRKKEKYKKKTNLSLRQYYNKVNSGYHDKVGYNQSQAEDELGEMLVVGEDKFGDEEEDGYM